MWWMFGYGCIVTAIIWGAFILLDILDAGGYNKWRERYKNLSYTQESGRVDGG